jgi:hypothetical protein
MKGQLGYGGEKNGFFRVPTRRHGPHPVIISGKNPLLARRMPDAHPEPE